MPKGDGVRGTEERNSYTKFNKKKLGSSHKIIFFISKKSSMINQFANKIKTFFFQIPYTIHLIWLYLL